MDKTQRITAEQYRKGITPQFKGRLSSASPRGVVVDGARFGTALEARVYLWLKPQLRPDEKLLLQLRCPLISDSPRISPASKTGWISIDFTVWRAGIHLPGDEVASSCWKLCRAVDAKPKRRQAHSRDWRRGARAFLATYGFEIEEVEL